MAIYEYMVSNSNYYYPFYINQSVASGAAYITECRNKVCLENSSERAETWNTFLEREVKKKKNSSEKETKKTHQTREGYKIVSAT